MEVVVLYKSFVLIFLQKYRLISRALLVIGVVGMILVGYSTFFSGANTIGKYLLSSGYSQDEIDERLAYNPEKDSAHRSLDFPQKVSPLDPAHSFDSRGRGISVSAGGQSTFYPFETIAPYEVVNDIIAGQPILIAYCTECETAVIADRFFAGEEHFFQATDHLWEDSLIMISTGNTPRLWQQASGRELTTFSPVTLDFLPFDITSLAQYRSQYPNGKVMVDLK